MLQNMNKNLFRGLSLAIILSLVLATFAWASDVDVAVVDVTAPTGSVELVPGGSAAITINMSVTGKQEGTATFEVYRDWTLSGGTFTGSNAEVFTVDPRAATDPATNFSTSGTVTIAAGQAAGTFTLEVGAFDITNSNATGAKLGAGDASSYAVTVTSPPADTTPPTITITTPADGTVYLLNEVVYADYSCEDEAGGSGLASCVGTFADGDSIDTSSVGPKSFTVNAADNAGNTASLTHNYSVIYDFAGFFPPVDNTPTWNVAKAGSAIPVKFSLSGDQGLGILAAGYPKSSLIACGAGGTLDAIESTVTAGGSSLSYDALADQYVYVWKTDKAWANTCRQLEVKLNDGTSHFANFEFKK